MNTYEQEYYNDIKSRRAMANGAAHRKGGSKSKKCTLPCDSLTQGQLKALNGEVKVYKLGQPLTQEEYDKLPDDLKPMAKLISTDQAGGDGE